MKSHKFKLGDHVALQGSIHGMADGRDYEITRLLPQTSPEPQYRIKRSIESHERVVDEHMLCGIDQGR